MVLSGPNKVSSSSSMTNQTCHFGIMGGLAPSVGLPAGVGMFRLRRARNKQPIPTGCIPGLEYMKEHDILSKNPAGSGGIGLTKVLVDRSMGPCNCGAGKGANIPVAGDEELLGGNDVSVPDQVQKQEWRSCVWSTPGYSVATPDGPCGERTGGSSNDEGSDPSTGADCKDFYQAAALSKNGEKYDTKGLQGKQHLLPIAESGFFKCCSKGDAEAAFPPSGQYAVNLRLDKGLKGWAFIVRSSIGSAVCSTGGSTEETRRRWRWWQEKLYGGVGKGPQSPSDIKGRLVLKGHYLKTLVESLNNKSKEAITNSLQDDGKWKEDGITAYAANGHGMWGGTCANFDLSLFLRTNSAYKPTEVAEGKPFFIMNMQTGPRTWSGEISPFGSNGNTASPEPHGSDANAEVPVGMTLSGEDEMGESWASLDIFEDGENGEIKLKAGISHFGPPDGPAPSGGCTGCTVPSSGPCKAPNGVCFDYVGGVCPGGTTKC